ncbi:hypothetical protein Rhow_001155 [Rhodococcus wratislaviensis]|uniref:Uncharacterized protein n=1 Tax=Rhodococcus wratislaviensis TaxID=44752 RepID=A0A402C3I0_RHOWR|nr:hypothetical protein Rhow_001155 [Rhodococcus wratislaviensis]
MVQQREIDIRWADSPATNPSTLGGAHQPQPGQAETTKG